jgi:hypothetical protein
MTSHGKARPLLTLAAIAALAAGITACNSGGSSGSQYGYDPSNTGYSNSSTGYTNPGTSGNQSAAIGWETGAQENANSAISDLGPGGAADPADESNSVSYSGGSDGGDGD